MNNIDLFEITIQLHPSCTFSQWVKLRTKMKNKGFWQSTPEDNISPYSLIVEYTYCSENLTVDKVLALAKRIAGSVGIDFCIIVSKIEFDLSMQ